MICPDCCDFHDALRWVGQAFLSGHFYLGVAGGILLIFGLALFFDI